MLAGLRPIFHDDPPARAEQVLEAPNESALQFRKAILKRGPGSLESQNESIVTGVFNVCDFVLLRDERPVSSLRSKLFRSLLIC